MTSIRQLKDIVPGVKCHREKYDGSGYPDGLKGNAIPVIPGIISVADIFDAMTTDRPYRRGLSIEAALQEMKRRAGTRFDAGTVDAFVKSCEEGILDRA